MTTPQTESSVYYFDASLGCSNEPETEKSGNGSRLHEVEARLSILETAILEHATILRDRIGQRLDRLEDRLRYEATGLRRAMADEKDNRDEKIIQLTESFTAAVDRVELKQESGSVKATMEDLIAALAATRTHLDTLAHAVTKTRAEVSAGSLISSWIFMITVAK